MEARGGPSRRLATCCLLTVIPLLLLFAEIGVEARSVDDETIVNGFPRLNGFLGSQPLDSEAPLDDDHQSRVEIEEIQEQEQEQEEEQTSGRRGKRSLVGPRSINYDQFMSRRNGFGNAGRSMGASGRRSLFWPGPSARSLRARGRKLRAGAARALGQAGLGARIRRLRRSFGTKQEQEDDFQSQLEDESALDEGALGERTLGPRSAARQAVQVPLGLAQVSAPKASVGVEAAPWEGLQGLKPASIGLGFMAPGGTAGRATDQAQEPAAKVALGSSGEAARSGAQPEGQLAGGAGAPLVDLSAQGAKPAEATPNNPGSADKAGSTLRASESGSQPSGDEKRADTELVGSLARDAVEGAQRFLENPGKGANGAVSVGGAANGPSETRSTPSTSVGASAAPTNMGRLSLPGAEVAGGPTLELQSGRPDLQLSGASSGVRSGAQPEVVGKSGQGVVGEPASQREAASGQSGSSSERAGDSSPNVAEEPQVKSTQSQANEARQGEPPAVGASLAPPIGGVSLGESPTTSDRREASGLGAGAQPATSALQAQSSGLVAAESAPAATAAAEPQQQRQSAGPGSEADDRNGREGSEREPIVAGSKLDGGQEQRQASKPEFQVDTGSSRNSTEHEPFAGDSKLGSDQVQARAEGIQTGSPLGQASASAPVQLAGAEPVPDLDQSAAGQAREAAQTEEAPEQPSEPAASAARESPGAVEVSLGGTLLPVDEGSGGEEPAEEGTREAEPAQPAGREGGEHSPLEVDQARGAIKPSLGSLKHIKEGLEALKLKPKHKPKHELGHVKAGLEALKLKPKDKLKHGLDHVKEGIKVLKSKPKDKLKHELGHVKEGIEVIKSKPKEEPELKHDEHPLKHTDLEYEHKPPRPIIKPAPSKLYLPASYKFPLRPQAAVKLHKAPPAPVHKPPPAFYESPRLDTLPAKCGKHLHLLTDAIGEVLDLIETIGQQTLLDKAIDYSSRAALSRRLAAIRSAAEEARLAGALSELQRLNETGRLAGVELMRLARGKELKKFAKSLRPLALKVRKLYIEYRRACKSAFY